MGVHGLRYIEEGASNRRPKRYGVQCSGSVFEFFEYEEDDWELDDETDDFDDFDDEYDEVSDLNNDVEDRRLRRVGDGVEAGREHPVYSTGKSITTAEHVIDGSAVVCLTQHVAYIPSGTDVAELALHALLPQHRPRHEKLLRRGHVPAAPADLRFVKGLAQSKGEVTSGGSKDTI